MGRRDVRHGSRVVLWLPVVLVLGVLVAALTAYVVVDRPDPVDDPADNPAAVAPPEGLVLPPVTPPAPVAATAAAGPLNPAKVRRALAPLLDDDDLGPHVLATVSGLDGAPLYSRGSGAAIPASTLKLLTSAAALETLGPDQTFDTVVVAEGQRQVVLVGGGDPLLARADLKQLARATARQVSGRILVGYDAYLFSGPEVSPHWPDGYVPDGVVSPIQALWIDEGRDADGFGRVDDPAAVAAQAFADELVKAGVKVTGTPEPRFARRGSEVARVSSEPLSQLVEHTLETSDNEAAEVLARHVGLATGRPASFQGGAAGILETMTALGVPTKGAEVYDGSGLSRDNLVDPDTLTALLELAGSEAQPDLRAVLTGLPVAGFTGSLTERFEDDAEAGLGFVRAKTGTLTGVSGLAGTVTDADGRPIVFALLADRIDLLDTLGARDALDEAASALAACRCG